MGSHVSPPPCEGEGQGLGVPLPNLPPCEGEGTRGFPAPPKGPLCPLCALCDYPPPPQTAQFACPNVLDKQNAAMLQMTASTTESQPRGPGGDSDMPVLIRVSLPVSRLMDPSNVPRCPPRGSGM